MCLARCSYEGGPETGRGGLARDRRYRGSGGTRKRKRKRVRGAKGQGNLCVGGTWPHGNCRLSSFPAAHRKVTTARSTPRLQPQRHRDRSQLYSYKIEYPTHPRPVYTRSKIIQESRFNTEYACSEPRGVWLCTLPSGSGYRHKHTHTTVLPACHFVLYLATLVC